jgi:hypothetical protein
MNFSSLDNTQKWKFYYLKRLYNKKIWVNDNYGLNGDDDSNKFLDQKIKKIVDNIEKKINNKERFNIFLWNIKKKLETINKNYKNQWLKIASRINQKSDISKIFKEYEKYIYKWEVLEILWKYISFKQKENYYDSTINDIFEK